MSDGISRRRNAARIVAVEQKDAPEFALSRAENRRSLAHSIVEIFALEFSLFTFGADIRLKGSSYN